MWWYTIAVLSGVTVWVIARLEFSPRDQQGVASPRAACEPDQINLAREQLANAVAISAKQDQLVWTVFGVFWTADAVLLVALFTSGELPSREVAIVVAAVGCLLSLVWSIIQFRSIASFRYYELIIERLESDEYLAIPAAIALTKSRNNVTARGFQVRRIMIGCPVSSTTAWLIFLLYAVFAL